MRGRDWFVVGARLIGVWVLYSAFSFVANAFAIHFAIRLGYRPDAPEGYPKVYLIEAFLLLCFALYLLLGTGHLEGLCYGKDGDGSSRKPKAAESEPPGDIE